MRRIQDPHEAQAHDLEAEGESQTYQHHTGLSPPWICSGNPEVEAVGCVDLQHINHPCRIRRFLMLLASLSIATTTLKLQN